MPKFPLLLLSAIALVLPLAAQNTQPMVLRKVEPKYSEQARSNKIQGTVVLKVVVAVDGRATEIHVTKSLDKELDENAVAAVKEWLFKPGTKDGTPVAVFASVEVPFRLK
jgi:protein TonB